MSEPALAPYRTQAPTSGGSVPAHRGNNFDLLRLVFASIVLLSHSYELIDGNRSRELLTSMFHTISFGELGVDLFFILSGYLITASWIREPKVFTFLRKRVLRIYPGFLVAFLLSTFVVGVIGAQSVAGYWRGLDWNEVVGHGLTLQSPKTPAVFMPWPYAVVNGSLWTVRFEFFCYMVVLGLGMTRLLTSRHVPVVLWAVTLGAFVALRFYRIDDVSTGTMDGGVPVILARCLPMFFAGSALYVTGLARFRPAWLVLAAVALLIAGLSYKGTAEAAVASFGAYLVIVAGQTPLKLVRLRRLPDISYGVYLYGWPVQKLIIFAGVDSPLPAFAASLACSFGLGLASWHLVEKQALRLNRARGPRRAG